MTINSDTAIRGRHEAKKARQLHAKPILASATVLTLGLSGVLFTGGVANAAPGSSEASARYLSGDLLGTNLDNVAAVAGENAAAGANTDATVTNSGNLDLSALGNTLNLQVRDGVTVPLSVTDAGVLSQYASASQDGSSKAASGLVANDGVIDVDGTDAAPQQLSLDLSNLIGADLADSVANLEVSTGVNTASASKTATGAPVGDYRIGDLTTSFTSPVLAGLSDRIQTAGDGVEATANGILAQDGSLVSGIAAAVSSLGGADVTSTGATVNLDPTIQNVLQQNQVLGADGPVQINLANGEVTVNIQALLAANGRDLNDLAPGEDILDTEVVGFITTDVDELVNGLLTQVQDAVALTLASTDVTVSATVGDPVNPVLVLSTNGTVAEIIAGVAPPTITVTDETYDVAPLNALVESSLRTVLGARLDTNAINAPLSATYPELDAVLTSLVRLQANLQENADGEFTETALRLSVLNAPVDGQALALNLAQAAVGPNVAPTADTPTLTTITPNSGPEAGFTIVTITGSGFTGADGVFFGNKAAISYTVDSDTQITAVTPAGIGAVDVNVTDPNGSAVSPVQFTYIPTAPIVDLAVTDVAPNQGPTTGGTPITITGTGFLPGASVLIDSKPATNVTVVSDTEITAVTPTGTAGPASVVVTNPGTAPVSLNNGFTYVAPRVGSPNDGGVSNGNGANDPNGVSDGNGVAPSVQNDFANCTEAEAAGQSNFPSTNRNLDADGDGVACETNGDSGTKRDLAYTGAEIAVPGIVGGVLIALGGVLYFMRRRIFA